MRIPMPLLWVGVLAIAMSPMYLLAGQNGPVIVDSRKAQDVASLGNLPMMQPDTEPMEELSSPGCGGYVLLSTGDVEVHQDFAAEEDETCDPSSGAVAADSSVSAATTGDLPSSVMARMQ